ncbi:WXG100-like domain-containing protein [Nocardia sp. NPDC004573]
MDSSGLLAEVPSAVRELVLGHWPETDVDGMRRSGDAYLVASGELNTSADRYEVEAAGAEQAVEGATSTALAERHRVVVQSMRDQAAVCQSLGKQCHDVADSAVQTQHLLIAMGIALAAQLAYDALLFFQGGGATALIDRIEAERAMAAAAARLTAEVGERAAAGAAQRAALHTAVHAAKIGLLTSAAISGGAQLWDLQDGVRDKFDVGAFLEMLLGGVVGGVAGAEVGRRLAPRVLGWTRGTAVTPSGRLAAHLGGTMLLGGAGGLAGGLAGAVPSVLIHLDEIHSLGDLFKMVRESAITGFGSGFVGAAGSAIRVHTAGRNTVRSESDTPRLGLRHWEFAARVNELLSSGEPPRVETIERFGTEGKSARVVERLIFHDGTEVIHKVVSDPQHAHAEFLSSLVGDAVGARVPAVHVIGDHVYMEVVPGTVAAETYPRRAFPPEVLSGPAGMRQGVMDVLIRMPDRNSDNWMVDPDENVWGIDHSRAFETFPDAQYVAGPFAENFLSYGDSQEILWNDHALTRSEMHEIRQRVEELSPVFHAAGRRDWYDGMLQRMTALEEHAAGGGDLRRVIPPHVAAPPPSGEAPASVSNRDGGRAPDGPGVSVRPPADRPGWTPGPEGDAGTPGEPGTPHRSPADEVLDRQPIDEGGDRSPDEPESAADDFWNPSDDLSGSTDVFNAHDQPLRDALEYRRPVDWGELIRDNRILLLGEDHSNVAARQFLQEQAAALRAAGVTHYGIEAPHHPAIDALNAGLRPDLTGVRFGPGWKTYREVVEAMAAEGITIVPFDVAHPASPHGSALRDVRESAMAKNITEVMAADPNAKMVVLVGRLHITRDPAEWAMTTGAYAHPLAARLEDAGLTSKTVGVWGGNDPLSAVEQVRASGETFMADLPSRGDADGRPPRWEADAILHLRRGEGAFETEVGGSHLPPPESLPAPRPPTGPEPEAVDHVRHRAIATDDPDAVHARVTSDLRAVMSDWGNQEHAFSAVHLGDAMLSAQVFLTSGGGELTATKTGEAGARVLRVEVSAIPASEQPPGARTEIPLMARAFLEQRLWAFAHRYDMEQSPDGGTVLWFELDEGGPDFSAAAFEAVHGSRSEEASTGSQPDAAAQAPEQPSSEVPDVQEPASDDSAVNGSEHDSIGSQEPPASARVSLDEMDSGHRSPRDTDDGAAEAGADRTGPDEE